MQTCFQTWSTQPGLMIGTSCEIATLHLGLPTYCEATSVQKLLFESSIAFGANAQSMHQHMPYFQVKSPWQLLGESPRHDNP